MRYVSNVPVPAKYWISSLFFILSFYFSLFKEQLLLISCIYSPNLSPTAVEDPDESQETQAVAHNYTRLPRGFFSHSWCSKSSHHKSNLIHESSSDLFIQKYFAVANVMLKFPNIVWEPDCIFFNLLKIMNKI